MRRCSMLLSAAASMAAFLLPQSAAAQVLCGERAAVLAGLAERFAEQPAAAGLAANGQVVELLVAPDGSWTLLLSRPDGVSCLIGGGVGWAPAVVRNRKGESAL